MPTSLFDRVAGLVEEIGAEKQAAAQEKQAETGIPDPGGAEGPTSHPSTKTDDDLQPSSEGEQSADNEKRVKDMIPDSVDSKSDESPEGAPKATDVQQGDTVAKPTGEDPSTEEDYKGKLEGDKREGDQGGTSHPAKGDYGEKYSADAIATMSDEELLKSAADIGNELTAEIANGHFSSEPTPAQPATTTQAAEAGQKTAEKAGELGDALEKVASGVVQELVKSAYHQADLVTDHLAEKLSLLQKQAEGEAEDPTSGAGEGEDHGTEEGGGSDPSGEPPVGGEEMGGEVPPEGAEELLAAMGGGGLEEAGAGPEMAPEGMGGPEMGGPPPEMGGMGDEAALQQLAMALMEMGIDPAQLAAMAQPEAQKIAAAVQSHKASGKFQFEEAKTGSAERKVRDYMKGFVSELYQRSRK